MKYIRTFLITHLHEILCNDLGKNTWDWLPYKKNNATPETAITAPMIYFKFTFYLKKITAGTIIVMGTIDIIVDATPVVVC